MDVDTESIVSLPLLQAIASPVAPDNYDAHRGKNTALVIDNGSSTLRFGFADSKTPHTGPNTVSKYKERKTNKPLLVFGDAVEVESAAKTQIRTPWEGDVLLNFDALENVLDYAFVQLGLEGDSIAHPILMTERLASPLHSRSLTSELLFELYSAPSVAYCVDSVMSLYNNNIPKKGQAYATDAVVVSFNTASTSVIPILDGKGVMSSAKRIPFGASQATEYLLKLVQMKYPTFPQRLVPVQSNWLLRTFCEFSSDYPALLRTLKDPLQLRSSERIVQFPYTLPVADERTQEELDRITERRREQGRKLQEMAAKARLEKLVQREAELQHLLELKDRRRTMNKKEWMATLENEGFEDEGQLDATVKKLEVVVKKGKKKAAGEPDDEPVDEEPPSFPLVDVPDDELDEEQIKEKRKQRLMKAGYDARMRTREQKARDAEERAADIKREEEERDRDLTGWSSKLKRDHDVLITKLKDRMRRKNDLGDRKSAATQARMKNIANLAAEEKRSKGKRKTGGDDMFGADDADWAIYRKINTQATSSDEEDDLQNLQEIESKLLAHDPEFTIDDTYASITTQKSALLAAFHPEYDEGDFAGHSRIHLTTERWRVCEAWFSPNMAGVDSAGIGEVIQSVLSNFNDVDKARMVNNVFITGGPSQLPGLSDRLYTALRPTLAPETPLRITRAVDPVLDAWKGMANFANTPTALKRVSVSKAEYEEWGGEQIKRWWGGNWNSSVSK